MTTIPTTALSATLPFMPMTVSPSDAATAAHPAAARSLGQ